MEINYVISHGSCSDGTMCKAIAKRFLKSREVTYMDAYYKTDYSYLPPLLYGNSVLICDYSFSADIMKEIIHYTKGNVYVLDHHLTAEANLKDIEEKYKHLDMKKCGAVLTWEYFTKKKIPEAVLYVQDYDLWHHSLPNTKEFNAYIKSLNFNVDSYESLLDGFPSNALSIGEGLLLAERLNVENICKKAVPLLVEIKDRYYFVPHVFSYLLKSEVGNRLLSVFPHCHFSVVFSTDYFKGHTSMSLRSEDSREDVRKIAELFGGGGHRNASGIEVQSIIAHLPTRILDWGKTYRYLSSITVDEEGKASVTVPKDLRDNLYAFLTQKRDDKLEVEHILNRSITSVEVLSD